jgi:hypothetical protein
MSYHVANVAYQLLTDPNTYKNIEGRLGLAVTHFPFTHTRHWSWHSNDELMECIIASCHMPIYCEALASFKGRIVVDGAYSVSGHDFVHGDETLFVGIDPHAEITRHLTQTQMIYPPQNDEEYYALSKTGYEAMMNWDGKMKQKVGKRFPNYPMIVVMWPLRIMQSIWDFAKYYVSLIILFVLSKIFPHKTHSSHLHKEKL